MSPITLYDVSITPILRSVHALVAILAKAEAHAAEKGTNPDAWVGVRLAEDMLPLAFQVQTVSNIAKKAVLRLTGAEQPEWADDETTLAQLRARAQKTAELLEAVDRARVDGREDEVVTFGLGPGREAQLPAREYVAGYSVPNVFFHVTTTYAILRHLGVPLGKADFLGSYLPNVLG